MAKSEFTEMQFVLGFVSEYTDYLRSTTRQFPFFQLPSPYVEKSIGIDAMIDHFDHMEFHQYKRSDFLKTYNASEYAKGLSRSIKPYYRFDLHEKKVSMQFTRLRILADMSPDHKVYYVAPKFHTLAEFHDYFWNKKIMQNTIFVNCLGFNSARIRKYLRDNPGEHTMVFDANSDTRYLFSEGIEMNEDDAFYGYEKISRQGGRKLFNETVKRIFYSLIEEEPKDFLVENRHIEQDLKTQFNWVRTTLLVKYNINMIPLFNE